jgi:hypothetical protein
LADVTADEEDAPAPPVTRTPRTALQSSVVGVRCPQQPPMRCVQAIGERHRLCGCDGARRRRCTIRIVPRCKPSGEHARRGRPRKAEDAAAPEREPVFHAAISRWSRSQRLLTWMPDAVEVLGGMSKGRCRQTLAHQPHAWHVLPARIACELMEVIVRHSDVPQRFYDRKRLTKCLSSVNDPHPKIMEGTSDTRPLRLGGSACVRVQRWACTPRLMRNAFPCNALD